MQHYEQKSTKIVLFKFNEFAHNGWNVMKESRIYLPFFII